MNQEKKQLFKSFRARDRKPSLSNDTSVPPVIKRKTNYILNNTFSLVIYLFTFIIFYYIKKRTLILEDNYYQLLGFLAFSLIVGAVISNKFILTVHHELWQTLRKLCLSLILSLGFLSILLLLFQIFHISRGVLIGTMFSGLVFEAYYYFMISDRRRKISIVEQIRPSINYLLIDGLILSIFCYVEIIQIIKPENLKEKHFIMLLVIYLSWIFSAATTHKFQLIKVAKSKWDATGLQVKFYLLMISLVVLSIYLLQIKPPDWDYFLACIAKYSLISGLLALFLFIEKIQSKTDEATTSFLKAYEHKELPVSFVRWDSFLKHSFANTVQSESVVKQKLQFEYLKEYQDVFTFIDKKLDLKSFNISKTLIIRSADPYNINVQPPDSLELIVNLHVLNDQIKINEYLRNVNTKLVNGGVFVGVLVPDKNRYSRYLKKYPFLIANLFYFIDFIWKRAFPKLPITKKIYFLISKGKDRAISLAEGLGRLAFCGFETLTLNEINDQVYFIAGKLKESSYEKNPYYGPIFKMRRVGKGGKTIFVYKLRTMHPYSEYIQQFVFEKLGSLTGDKINDDFRVSSWSKFLRKFWLDELPMLANLIKGDLKLFGVRPLSNYKLSQYPKDFQNIRIKAKPGLVPPYYFDLPSNFDELVESERKYLELYFAHPIKTDIKYLFKTVINILIKGKRSA